MTFCTREEQREAIRMIRAEGHSVRPGPTVDQLIVRRMDGDRPAGPWQLICVGFYDAWLDGGEVPENWS